VITAELQKASRDSQATKAHFYHLLCLSVTEVTLPTLLVKSKTWGSIGRGDSKCEVSEIMGMGIMEKALYTTVHGAMAALPWCLPGNDLPREDPLQYCPLQLSP